MSLRKSDKKKESRGIDTVGDLISRLSTELKQDQVRIDRESCILYVGGKELLKLKPRIPVDFIDAIKMIMEGEGYDFTKFERLEEFCETYRSTLVVNVEHNDTQSREALWNAIIQHLVGFKKSAQKEKLALERFKLDEEDPIDADGGDDEDEIAGNDA